MEQPVPQPKRHYTVEQYLAMEETSDARHEFRDGQIINMPGGTFGHNLIVKNVQSGINGRLGGSGCVAISNDMRVQVTGSGRYYYPDVVVVCGSPVFNPPDRQTTLVNPRVIVEVLSPSTADFDRGEKFNDYIGIETLQDYVLIAQDRPRVQTFYRQPDGIWAVGPWAIGLDGQAAFRSLHVTLPLAEVYAGVELPPVTVG